MKGKIRKGKMIIKEDEENKKGKGKEENKGEKGSYRNIGNSRKK